MTSPPVYVARPHVAAVGRRGSQSGASGSIMSLPCFKMYSFSDPEEEDEELDELELEEGEVALAAALDDVEIPVLATETRKHFLQRVS